jgi:glucose uptake protein GlcU
MLLIKSDYYYIMFYDKKKKKDRWIYVGCGVVLMLWPRGLSACAVTCLADPGLI